MSVSTIGIALENQSRMFHEFVQFNRNTLQGGGGSGLGLWICRNLAAMHGGAMVSSSHVLVLVLEVNSKVLVQLLPTSSPIYTYHR